MLTDAPPRRKNLPRFLDSDRQRELIVPPNTRLHEIAQSIESAMSEGVYHRRPPHLRRIPRYRRRLLQGSALRRQSPRRPPATCPRILHHRTLRRLSAQRLSDPCLDAHRHPQGSHLASAPSSARSATSSATTSTFTASPCAIPGTPAASTSAPPPSTTTPEARPRSIWSGPRSKAVASASTGPAPTPNPRKPVPHHRLLPSRCRGGACLP